MSKEQEAYQQRTVGQDQPVSNPQPQPGYQTLGVGQLGSNPQQTSAVPGYTYNTAVPGPVANSVHPQGNSVATIQNKKSLVEAYLLWLVLGLLGAHHFYLKVSLISFFQAMISNAY